MQKTRQPSALPTGWPTEYPSKTLSTYSTLFSFTGSMQTFQVPSKVFSVTIEAVGAAGGYDNCGSNSGGLGGLVQATINVTSKQTLYVYVGGTGSFISGGFNGGGNGFANENGCDGGGGGGASDVRTSPTDLTSRIIVAGGGGGGGCGHSGSNGGALVPGDGGAGNGAVGVGGDGKSGPDNAGGGGGYVGGGGGANCNGGGGGSSYHRGVLITLEAGTNSGNGYVRFTFRAPSTILPTGQPSDQPKVQPSHQPTGQPTTHPTGHPSSQPTGQPTAQPSNQPTGLPTTRPSKQPTGLPTLQPSTQPSGQPTARPSTVPSTLPSSMPSSQPTSLPTLQPTTVPTGQPTAQPSTQPSHQPSTQPSTQPSCQPTAQPLRIPTGQPTLHLSNQPTSQPTDQPTGKPSTQPSDQPTGKPSAQPTDQPARKPSAQPTDQPTGKPSAQPTDQPTGQPTSKPSGRPAGKPTSKPTYHPSRHPTIAPSPSPTSKPVTSAPTTLGQTLPPTSKPTSLPTEDLIHYGSTLAYQYYNSSKAKVHGKANSITYTSFAYKGRSIEGSCSLWQKHVSGSLAIPSDQYYFSSLTYSLGYYSPPSVASYNLTFTCDSRASLSTIISYMQRQLYVSESLDLQVPCGSHNWQVFLCSGSIALCVDCYFQCSCPDSEYILNPCAAGSGCYGNHASYGILSFSYASLLIVPQVSVVRVVPSRVTVQLSVNVSMEGHLYCYAAPFNASISSPLYIRQYGAPTLVISKNALTIVTVSGLSPSTTYDVYLYAESLLGYGMDLAAVRGTKTRVTTSCCSGIIFVTKYSSLLQYSRSTSAAVDSNVFTFSLDFIPSQDLVVSVIVSPVGCAGVTPSDSSHAGALPSSFLFTPGSLSPSGNFVVHGTAGCYVVSVFPGSGSTTKNATAAVTIYSSIDQLSDPTIASATFSSDGLTLLIDFDSATDYGDGVGASSHSEFQCNKLLSFVGAQYAKCKWTSSRSIVAVIDGSMPASSVGDPVLLLSSALHPATQLTASASKVLIQSPVSPSPPAVSLSTASTIGSCDDLILDPTASSGSGGRPWSKVQWVVSGSGAPAADAATVSAYLNSHYNTSTSKVAVVPRRLFTPGGSLTITLLLQNFLGVLSASASAITISSSASIPRVNIAGSSQVSIYRSDTLQLFASAAAPSCGNISSLALTYSWRVYIDANYQASIVSKSLNNRVFLLPPNSLKALTKYTIQVTVTTVTGSSNSHSVLVYVGRAGVYAAIGGGSQRTVSSTDPLIVDASGSYDMDYHNSSSLSYSWRCYISSPVYGSQCQLNLSRVAVLNVTSGKLLSDSTYNFNVIVVSKMDGSFSIATVVIAVVAQPLPRISFNDVNTVYNAGDRTVLNAIVKADFSFKTVWDCLNCSFDLSTVSRSQLKAFFSRGTVRLSLAISPNSMTAGLLYTFQLSAGYGANPTPLGSASINIVANGPPYGGLLSVSPSEGYTMTTYFYINTYNWIDAPSDYPLQYSMGYYSSPDAPVLYVQSMTQLSYVSTYLGQGLVSMEYEVSCVVYCSDAHGATASTSVAVIVLPPRSLDDLRSAMYQQLGEAEAILNPDLTSSVVNAVASSLNSANCTLSPNCSTLNRAPCSLVAQTCGDCVPGYLGIAGPANTPCKLSSALRPTGSSCLSDSDCVSHSCTKGTCTLSAKLCPANCTSHTQGDCVDEDGNGLPIKFCDANDLSCQAKCLCHAGWYGIDCSLTWDHYETVVGMREQMCASYYAATLVQVRNCTHRRCYLMHHPLPGRILRCRCITGYDYSHHINKCRGNILGCPLQLQRCSGVVGDKPQFSLRL